MRNQGNRTFAFIHKCVAVLMMLLTLPSCSVIGLSVGAVLNQLGPNDIVPAEAQMLLGLGPGTRVRWTLADSTRGQGVLTGTSTDDRDQYSERYAAWRASLADSNVVPALGDVVLLETEALSFERVRFDGVVHQSLWLRTNDGRSVMAPLSSTRAVRAPSRAFDIFAARKAWTNAPRRSSGTLQLRTRTGPQTIDVARIVKAEVREPGNV
ncbi:MAG: hypothetical protein RL112_2345, partial [Planctomycetota bacterium]